MGKGICHWYHACTRFPSGHSIGESYQWDPAPLVNVINLVYYVSLSLWPLGGVPVPCVALPPSTLQTIV